MTRFRDIHPGIGEYAPGPLNAITDVAGVRVGHTTLIEGDGPLVPGKGPVRTGVTIVHPRAEHVRDSPCYAGTYTLNGNGELTGQEWIRESGLLTTPIGLTNTHSVGVVRDAIAAHDSRSSSAGAYWSMPVVGETYDGILNDIHGQHVTTEHVRAALESTTDGPVAEGSVGGGTGMNCHGFKAGIGTSSRRLSEETGGWTVGVLVQANYGARKALRVDGVPVGRLIPESEVPAAGLDVGEQALPPGAGSIIVVVATDAPLLPDQCRRMATNAAVGLSRVGGGGSDPSGDIMIAFSTGNADIPGEYYRPGVPLTHTATSVPHQRLSPLLEAAADATEEAILNSLLAAEDMVGRGGVTSYALAPGRLAELLQQHVTWPSAR
jgi:D-aminopeptidase